MWVIDIRHWLNEQQDGPAVPQLKFKVNKLAEVITFATSRGMGLRVGEPPKCWRRPGRKPCQGLFDIYLTEDDRIYWKCPVCDDEGIMAGCGRSFRYRERELLFS